MWKYYIKMAWRNFKTNRLFGILNLTGLSIGIAICIPLFLFVRNELSFDNMYRNDIYRVNLKTLGGAAPAGETWACVPNSVAPAMMKGIPEVRSAARMLKNSFGAPASLKIGTENFKEDNLFWCDPELFKIFKFDFIAGNAKQPLKEVNDVAISASESRRLFNGRDPIGQIITVDNNVQLVVKGVYKDLPANSTIDCSIIANFQASRMSKSIYWSNASYETYCLLDKGANWVEVQKKLEQLVISSVEKKDRWFSLALQPLSKIHLYSKHVQDSYSMHTGDIRMVRNLAFLALLVLLIACINYMNLATARSEKRSKEVGINKTLGASRKNMVLRFYMDTALIGLLAMIGGFLLSFGSIHLFNYVTGYHLIIADLFARSTIYCLLALWAAITLLAGSYPALLLSGASALQLLQKQFKVGGLDKLLRKSLVVVQYSCSIILIIAVLVIIRQMKFIGEKDLGFKPKGVISLNLSGIRDAGSLTQFRNQLLTLPEVEDVAASQAAPGYGTSRRAMHQRPGDEGFPLYTSNADSHILKTLGMKLIAGHNLPENLQKGDTTCYVLVNKQVINNLGWTPAAAIGKKVNVELGDHTIIVGVVDNFNYASLKDPIGAYLFYSWNQSPEPINILLVRLGTEHLAASLQKVEDIFKKNIHDAAFDYQFLDTHLTSLYAAEKIMEKSAVLFSALAIFVSCLGLFGLSAFMAEQRFKEVGIRKVLGANSFNITRLLTLDFLKLVMLALVIGTPIAIWLMNSWLEHFTYRINISWTLIALAAVVGVSIAIVTVCFQAIKAARANPVKSLKAE